jgi:hypothetical protein
MGCAHPSVVGPVIQYVWKKKPLRILDCGCGWGEFGFLFRLHAETQQGATFHAPQTWRCTITGVEVFQPYIIPSIHGFVYDHVFVGELLDLARRCLLPRAQMIYLGDVLEHFVREAGEEILRLLFRLCDQSLVVSTPLRQSNQADLHGNEYQRHLSLWDENDLRKFSQESGAELDVLASGPHCLVAAFERRPGS